MYNSIKVGFDLLVWINDHELVTIKIGTLIETMAF